MSELPLFKPILQAEADAEYPADTLGLNVDEMQTLGYLVVDSVISHLRSRSRIPAIKTGDPQELRDLLGGDLPRAPGDAKAAIDLLIQVALSHQQHGDHPRYFARVPAPSSFAAILGEWLGTGFDTIAASWAGGSGPTTVELIVIDWLSQLMGLPPETEGILVSGGSIANLTALSAARATVGPGVVYLSDQTHSSVVRDLKELGYPAAHLRVLPTDDAFRMPLRDLKDVICRDRNNGLRPSIVVATAGTTNTGSVDPLNDLADLCKENSMWLHVDGAYGAPARMCRRGQRLLAGIERVDSLVLDPHKWLFQPYDIGCVLVARKGALESAYSMTPEYLQNVQGTRRGEVDMRNRSLELSRRSRALKVWLMFRVYGTERISKAVERGIELAEYAEAYLRSRSDLWEVVTPAQLGIVTFALRGGSQQAHEHCVAELANDGFAAATSTILKSRSVIRLCTINPLTRETDIRETIDRLACFADSRSNERE